MKRARKGYRTPRVGEGQAELDFRSNPVGSERGEGWISVTRYPELAWAGSIPSHWTVKKLGFLVSLKSGEAIEANAIDGAGEFPVYGGNGLRGYTTGFTHEGERVLVGRQGALCGNVNYANGKFWATEHALVASPLEPIVPKWLGTILEAMNLNQYSVSAAQPGLSADAISQLRVPIPPIKTQRAIAAYLARETGRIDGLIRAKEGLLGLLAEKRRALIARAVTRGLDPAAPLRDSGIPWLGAVPEHWEVKRLKWLLKAIEQGWSPQADTVEADDENWAVIKLSAIKQGKFFPRENKALPISYDIPFSLELRSGDFLITRSNTPSLVGDVCVVEETRPKLIFSDLVFRLQFDQGKIDPVFLKLILTTPIGRIQIEGDARGSSMSMVKISQEHVPNWRVPVPPLAEQRAIVAHVAAETAKLDALRASAERTIALLKERRAALISAAVTGRIEIPN